MCLCIFDCLSYFLSFHPAAHWAPSRTCVRSELLLGLPPFSKKNQEDSTTPIREAFFAPNVVVVVEVVVVVVVVVVVEVVVVGVVVVVYSI